ncbi:MAG: FKBP-type peptidyl-prolyl cis-trans isomerase [Bacteroidota bacterium]
MRFLFFAFIAIIFISGCGNDQEGPSFEEQLAIDIEAIDDYLTDNNIDAEVHSSGIRYIINQDGTGENPRVGDDIAIKHSVSFLDNTALGGDTIGLTINLSPPTIEAWRLMIPEVSEGGSITFYTPSGYAFGTRGNGAIPSNSILTYDVELLAIVENEDEQLEIDTLIIAEYLEEKNISSQTDDSGIRFRVITEGSGVFPDPGDEIVVKYEGRFLNGNVFDSNDIGIQFPLQNLIEAWKIMIPKMREGGKIEIYAPSRYCYSTSGTIGIPPNTILAFEIELVEVK